MLPGLKTLAAAVLLAVAVVTFAFGAAALLRVAHEEFAVLPTWRPAMDPLADTVAVREADMPTLAVLRVEPEPEIAVQPAPAAPLALPPVVESAPPPSPPQAAVVAALPPAPAHSPEPEPAPARIDLANVPYNAPIAGPRLMPEIATNDAPVALASLSSISLSAESVAPAAPDAEPLAFAPLPRPRPLLVTPAIPKRIVRRTPPRRVASRPAAPARQNQAPNPLQQLFN